MGGDYLDCRRNGLWILKARQLGHRNVQEGVLRCRYGVESMLRVSHPSQLEDDRLNSIAIPLTQSSIVILYVDDSLSASPL